MNEKIIPLSKLKIWFLIIGSILFVLLGVWFLYVDSSTISEWGYFNDIGLIRMVGIINIIFFGFLCLFGFYKITDSKPGLVINSKGICDNSSGVSAGFVSWEEILEFKIFELEKQKFIVILVKNPEKYIRSKNPLRNALNTANLKLMGSPIVISSNALKISLYELDKILKEYFTKYKNFS